jgi:hypothetical protein
MHIHNHIDRDKKFTFKYTTTTLTRCNKCNVALAAIVSDDKVLDMKSFIFIFISYLVYSQI